MSECAFCAIVEGERDAHMLYSDDVTAAFLDRNPATHGHTLVVPVAHERFLFAADESIAMAVFRTVRRVAIALTDALEPDGLSIFYTSADLVGEVTHAHVHLVPRYADDEIHLSLSRHALDENASQRLVEDVRDRL